MTTLNQTQRDALTLDRRRAMNGPPKQTRFYYSRLREYGLLRGTIQDAMDKRAERHARQKEQPIGTPTCRLQERKLFVRLGALKAHYADRAKAKNARRKNYDDPRETSDPTIGFAVREINHGRYSSRCTYARMTYKPLIHCAALILSPRLISFRLENDRKYITAPRGYCWQDSEGYLALTRINDEELTYRPDANELRDWQPAATLTALTQMCGRTLQEREQARIAYHEKRAATRRARGKRNLVADLEERTASTAPSATIPQVARQVVPMQEGSETYV